LAKRVKLLKNSKKNVSWNGMHKIYQNKRFSMYY